jgi:hypothetical protein
MRSSKAFRNYSVMLSAKHISQCWSGLLSHAKTTSSLHVLAHELRDLAENSEQWRC